MAVPLSLGPLPIGVLPWLLGFALAWLLARVWSARLHRARAAAPAHPAAVADDASAAARDTASAPSPTAGSVLFDMLVIGVLAARLAFVVLAWRSYLHDPIGIVMFGDGGFVAWVGLVAALAFAAWRLRADRVGRRVVLWSATLGILLALVLAQALAALQRDAPPLPDTAFARVDAAPLRLAPGDGRPTVVNLWATWCPPCRHELPVFVRAQRDWPGIRFVFADQGENAQTVRAFLPRAGLPAEAVVLDADSSLMQRYRSQALPTTLFFDAEGRLLEAHLGPLSEATLERRLRRLAPTGAR
jgi:thiol-disulfide isomerase/thioredoxin